MRIIYPMLALLIFPLLSFGQDINSSISKKTHFSFQTGFVYKTFWGNTYIEPTQYNYGDEFTDHQYERFTKKPTFGLNAGVLYSYQFKNHWGFTTGIVYFLKKDVFNCNQDTVLKYGNGSKNRNIHNVLKYEYFNNNLEIPIMIHYSIKKITLSTGGYFALFTYKKVNYTYVVNQFPNTPQYIISDKSISGFEMPFKIYSALQVNYSVQFKRIELKPLLAFYYAINNQNDFYIQLGINLPLIKNLKK